MNSRQFDNETGVSVMPPCTYSQFSVFTWCYLCLLFNQHKSTGGKSLTSEQTSQLQIIHFRFAAVRSKKIK
jgi:hypothetical protein